MALSPYQPATSRWVLVHGTASSAGRWAQMLNELGKTRAIHERYQFWCSARHRESGALLAMRLRETLASASSTFRKTAGTPPWIAWS